MASNKKITVLLLLCAVSLRVAAQGFSFGDLFGQAKKQKQLYLQQIAAYQAFRMELNQLYGVIKHGLSGIADINMAERDANDAYYAYLKQPSAAVKNNALIEDIVQWSGFIKISFGQHFELLDDEQHYFSAVRSGVFQDCDRDLAELSDLLSTKWQMTDEERLKRIEALHEHMERRYAFSRSFCNAVKLLIAQRQQDTNNTQTLMQLYEKD